jgi:hypothetical protein
MESEQLIVFSGIGTKMEFKSTDTGFYIYVTTLDHQYIQGLHISGKEDIGCFTSAMEAFLNELNKQKQEIPNGNTKRKGN